MGGKEMNQNNQNNSVPKYIVDELLKQGVDINKFPGKENQVCEYYGYNLNNENNNLNTTKINPIQKQNQNVLTKRLVFKPTDKRAAYIDSIILALITGLFGGIFLTILFMTIN